MKTNAANAAPILVDEFCPCLEEEGFSRFDACRGKSVGGEVIVGLNEGLDDGDEDGWIEVDGEKVGTAEGSTE